MEPTKSALKKAEKNMSHASSHVSKEEKNEAKKEHKKTAKLENFTVKIALNPALSQRVQAALKELKARKAECKAEDLLADFMLTVSDDYFEKEIEKRTPEEYYLETASQIPEIRAKLIEQAKKALLNQSHSDAPHEEQNEEQKSSDVLFDAPLSH